MGVDERYLRCLPAWASVGESGRDKKGDDVDRVSTTFKY